MKFHVFIICCFLLLLTSAGCVKKSAIPTEEEAEQVTLDYIYDKYGINVDIQNNETHRVGFDRYQRVSFSLLDSDTDFWYDVYVSYDDNDNKTPIVVSDTYMNEYLRPLLTKYLNDLFETEIAKAVNVYSREDVPEGFSADFPVVSNVDEVGTLIVTQELFFDYWIYVEDNTREVEKEVRNNLYLFKDDNVTFHIIRCTHEQFVSMGNEIKERNDFDLIISLDSDEITINTLESATN